MNFKQALPYAPYAGGLLSELLSSGDSWENSPQNQKLFEMLMQELNTPEDQFVKGMVDPASANLKSSIDESMSGALAHSKASAVRRGVFDPATFSGMSTQISNSGMKDYTRGVNDIQINARNQFQNRKMQLYSLLMNLSGQQRQKPGQDTSGMWGNMAGLTNQLSMNDFLKKFLATQQPDQTPKLSQALDNQSGDTNDWLDEFIGGRSGNTPGRGINW